MFEYLQMSDELNAIPIWVANNGVAHQVMLPPADAHKISCSLRVHQSPSPEPLFCDGFSTKQHGPCRQCGH